MRHRTWHYPLLALVLCGHLLAAPRSAKAEHRLLLPGQNSTVPACITLVGNDGGGTTDPSGRFSVVVRDLANNPVPGINVRVDVSDAPDLILCAQQQPGLTVHVVPGDMWAAGLTDATGTFTCSLRGHSNGAGNAVSLGNLGKIWADGVLLGAPSVAALDLDGASGMGANDLSIWLTDFGSGLPYGRSDYDCTGGIGANDLSVWLALFGLGRSAASCAP